MQIALGRAREYLGVSLSRIGLPGAIAATEINDAVTGDHIAVTVGRLFTVVSVNGRDYYWNRLTGKFDGTGTGCA